MSGKYALIIGNTEYTDPGLAQLTAPGKDAEDFARILKDHDLCAFDDVNILLNQPEYIVRETVDEFFDQKKPDDLLVLYFSGHGVRDELGSLYLAVKNTNRFRLRSTALKSDFIREAMDQSRSKRQVLILDCCNSGAFSQGTKAATGMSIGTATAFEAGYGRIILTASDSTQFAWEGNQVIGETDNSLFTHFLVEGLKGEADLDGDGRITVDELYDYAYDKVKFVTPKQTPSKFSSKQQGEIVLRQSIHLEDIKPVSLPDELMDEIEDTRPYVREAAVQKLEKILKGRNIAMARSAREALEKIAIDDDTTRRVSQMATQLLEFIRQQEQKAEEERRAKEEAELLAVLKAEEERLAAEKAAAERLLAEQKADEERKAKKEAKRLAALKAKEERLAREKVEAEQKAKQEAEEKRIAVDKVEAEQEAKEDARRLLAEKKAEEEQLTYEKAKAQPEAINRVAVKDIKPAKLLWISVGIVGTVIMCIYASVSLPSVIFERYSPTPTATKAFIPVVEASSIPLTETPTLVPTPLGGGNGRIVFSSNRDDPNSDTCGYTCDDEIYIMNADGSEQTRLTNNTAIDSSPAWSPDGKRIAFSSNRDGSGYQIYVMNADGSEQTRLTNNTAIDFSPAWSPDGKRIAFSSDRDGNDQIYVMNADGSEQTRLSNNSALNFWPDWSPDGKWITFSSSSDGNFEVYVISADGSEQRRLTNNSVTDLVPAWSPDGKWIAFSSDRDGNDQIYVMNADGSEQTRLTNNTAIDSSPAWSPDGKHIAFSSNRDEPNPHSCDNNCSNEIYVMNFDGSEQTRLTNNLMKNTWSAWQPAEK